VCSSLHIVLNFIAACGVGRTVAVAAAAAAAAAITSANTARHNPFFRVASASARKGAWIQIISQRVPESFDSDAVTAAADRRPPGAAKASLTEAAAAAA
jgi:hypothetical protein